MKILIIDDDEILAQALAGFLETDGHEVAIAHNGRHALEIAAANQPDAVLLDLILPHLDGFDLARRLRQIYGPALPIIGITGCTESTVACRIKAAGFNDYLTKPPDVNRLTELFTASRLT